MDQGHVPLHTRPSNFHVIGGVEATQSLHNPVRSAVGFLGQLNESPADLELCIFNLLMQVPAQHKARCKTHSPLMMALELGRTDIAEKLIELGASVAFKNKVNIHG